MLQAARSGFAWLSAWFLHTACRRGSASTVLSPTLSILFTIPAHPQYGALYYYGGWPGVVWAGAVRQVLMWHVTWLVNRQAGGAELCGHGILYGKPARIQASALHLAPASSSWTSLLPPSSPPPAAQPAQPHRPTPLSLHSPCPAAQRLPHLGQPALQHRGPVLQCVVAGAGHLWRGLVRQTASDGRSGRLQEVLFASSSWRFE